ncbi:MAG: hypothetical protein JWP87_1226 [Labilithrix sp.]|nr:hypothetical protein [Labilithrix sp.]
MITRRFAFRSLAIASMLAVAAGCAAPTDHTTSDGVDSTADELRGPGAAATDARSPEMGNDLRVLKTSKITMAQGIAEAAKLGPVIEAKFELNDDKELSLSLYPTSQPITVDAQRQEFKELAGDPTKAPFKGNVEVFADQEHLTRSARDLTLLQLSTKSLAQAVAEVPASAGFVFWAIPTMRAGRAGVGVYSAQGKAQQYRFIDGGGSHAHALLHLGTGPGAKATDQRVPELGTNLSVLKTAKIEMSAALAEAEEHHGATIEAKYEIGDDGKLSLSIYPVGKGIATDSERNTFFELAGDPTKTYFAPSKTEFKVPDAEHLTRSSRDLTLVQAAGFSLRSAVTSAEHAIPGGFVYWAIPTIRDTRAGYGVYVLGTDGKSHYLFIS